jgi:hypothetical protein
MHMLLAEMSMLDRKLHPLLRFINWLGGLRPNMDWPGIPLGEDEIIARAKKDAGWDELGSEEFREPLRGFLAEAKEARQLTCLGRMAISLGARTAIANRLRMNREEVAHPEILEQPIKRPIIIVGAPRTGTTLLLHLLSLDPASRPLLGWETFYPVPLKPNQVRDKIPFGLKVEMILRTWAAKAMAPELVEMHPFDWNMPDECHLLYLPSFVFPGAMALPGYHEWMLQQPESTYDAAYAEYRRALRMLEWQRPAQDHWVLKSPLHLWSLGALGRAMPEAVFVQTHRSMDQVLPSFCSLAETLIRPCWSGLVPRDIGPYAMQLARETVERFMAARETFDSSRILDLPMAELAADPEAAVRKVYATFGYDYTPAFDARVKNFVADETKSKPRLHHYTLDEFGLDRDEILGEFRSYHENFGLVADN